VLVEQQPAIADRPAQPFDQPVPVHHLTLRRSTLIWTVAIATIHTRR
jgi:hypothetical protein